MRDVLLLRAPLLGQWPVNMLQLAAHQPTKLSQFVSKDVAHAFDTIEDKSGIIFLKDDYGPGMPGDQTCSTAHASPNEPRGYAFTGAFPATEFGATSRSRRNLVLADDMKVVIATLLGAALFGAATYDLLAMFANWYGSRHIHSDADIN